MNLPREFAIDTANINAKWIENIYENLKKIEEYERLAREGCSSVLDFVQIPSKDRSIFLAETQYKNIRLLLNEFILVIPDVTLVIGEASSNTFMQTLEGLAKVINDKHAMINYIKSDVTNSVRDAKMTHLFSLSLKVLSEIRTQLIKELKNVLFVGDTRNARR